MSNPITRYLSIFAACFTFSACNIVYTVDRPVCESLDWYRLGLNLGRVGKYGEGLYEYNSRCAELQVEVDKPKFEEGYTAGLAMYCQPTNIYKVTQRANDVTFRQLCPSENQESLNYAYSLGQEYYESSSTLRRLEQEDSRLSSEESSLNSSISSCQYELTEKCKGVLEETKQNEIDSLRRELDSVTSERDSIALQKEREKIMLDKLEKKHLSLISTDSQ